MSGIDLKVTNEFPPSEAFIAVVQSFYDRGLMLSDVNNEYNTSEDGTEMPYAKSIAVELNQAELLGLAEFLDQENVEGNALGRWWDGPNKIPDGYKNRSFYMRDPEEFVETRREIFTCIKFFEGLKGFSVDVMTSPGQLPIADYVLVKVYFKGIPVFSFGEAFELSGIAGLFPRIWALHPAYE